MVAIVILVAFPLAIWGGVRYLKKKAEAKKLEKMVPTTVTKGDFVVKTQAAGTVEPEARVPVMPSFGGRIEEVLVKEGDAVKKGAVLAWMSSSERVALLDSAKVRGASADEQKMVEEAYRMIPMVSPIDGEVIKRAVEPGQPISPSQNAFFISDRLIVKTFVDESDIAKIRTGQRAEFVLDAYLKERYEGRVVSIAYDSTLQNNVTVYEVKLQPVTGASKLRAGMTAEVYVEIAKKKNILFVPKRAVKHKEGDTVVMLKPAVGPVKETSVTLGSSNETSTEVLKGLSEGDTVMTPSSSVPEEDSHVVNVE